MQAFVHCLCQLPQAVPWVGHDANASGEIIGPPGAMIHYVQPLPGSHYSIDS